MKQHTKTGFDWASKLGITVTNPKGWSSDEQFTTEKMSKTEFLNRASVSNIIVNAAPTRRSAAKLLKKI